MADLSAVDGQDSLKKDRSYSPASEREMEAKQDSSVMSSATAQEADVNADQIDVLPGTGGPDDVGGIEVDPGELNLSGDSIPGHPKPGSPEDV